ncbi:hypothetical protein MCUN1_003461 [Malassezia cuniculi]|uniref:Peroxisomal membrane protein PEX16 n=1 Tax=Malassezia cuniculi TaxID=948313 RepID=A0AAF0F1L2_9BASI|nr:hypothetical protein MCUN1_003461 [Malassezia cuniculi]
MMRIWGWYESFLLANAPQVTAVESSLRSITYILPGRFKDAEVTGEAIYTAVNLLGMYHDSVLFRIVYGRRRAAEGVVGDVRESILAGDVPRLSRHARYAHFWRTHSPSYRAAAVWLMIIENTQLLAEMLARRRLGRKCAWDVVLAIEIVKACLRITLVRATRLRPALTVPLPQREIDPALLERRIMPSNTKEALTWRGSRTGMVHRSLNALLPAKGPAKDQYEYLLAHTLTEQDVVSPPQLVRVLPGSVGQLGEGLWIARPLVYVLALRRWGSRSATPFALSLFLELLARSIRKRAYSSSRDAGPASPLSSVTLLLSVLGIENSFLEWLASLVSSNTRAKPISSVESDEWAARGRGLWWYFLRGPVWYRWTRPKIACFARRTEHRALIGMVGAIARDYLPLVDDYYYYSAS